MVSISAINAICQHVMRVTDLPSITPLIRWGSCPYLLESESAWWAFFSVWSKPLKRPAPSWQSSKKKKDLLEKYPGLPVTLDPSELSTGNKVLCTSITVFNNTIGNILKHCDRAALVSIVGPTAGYFPDPLFALGAGVVGGTFIHDGELFMQLVSRGERWGPATRKFCFQESTYRGLPQP